MNHHQSPPSLKSRNLQNINQKKKKKTSPLSLSALNCIIYIKAKLCTWEGANVNYKKTSHYHLIWIASRDRQRGEIQHGDGVGFLVVHCCCFIGLLCLHILVSEESEWLVLCCHGGGNDISSSSRWYGMAFVWWHVVSFQNFKICSP